MSVAKEIREEQKKALSTMSTRQKLEYFWEYYRVHTFAAIIIIALVGSLIRQYITNKDYAFYAVLINAVTTESNFGLNEIWNEEFLEYAQIDPDEYKVYIDTDFSMSDSVDAQFMIANQQKLVAMMQTGTVSAIVADTEMFEAYAQFEYFYDVKSYLSEEELEKYSPYLYYTDASTFEQANESPYETEGTWVNPVDLTVNHRDPSSMEQPIAVGIILTEDNMLADAGYYAYLTEAGYEYQGYPSDAVLGIPVTNKEPELVVRFLKYLNLGD